ncbi:thiamine pyrophosphate-dependent dehydrogenase E1 component subunit alpha [Streptomyces sp. NPDC047042]|uniref:thiamine pyrophosphate-dependent dehydrogenase E1 component subunit alpha n=1 Tax=Streptomyces sp. NPDC047042 TaxID=3154807 RepID=UPI0033C2AC90
MSDTGLVDAPGKDMSSSQDLLSFYETMSLIRAYEHRMMELRTAREVVGPVHPYVGQEAVAVGVCAALEPRDHLVSHYRGHGHALARGTSPVALTAELFGRSTGLCGGKAAALISDPDHNILVSSGLVGAGIPIAAGAAMTEQVRGTGGVAVVFFGDGALGSGVVHETLNMAVTQRLPLVMVCEHNGYQGGTRTEEVYPETSLLRVAQGHRMRAVPVDGNDVTAVHRAAGDAVSAARAGAGPTFIEARTYLTEFHLQFDKPSTEKRPEEELRHWRARDPLILLARRLLADGVAQQELDRAQERSSAVVTDAVQRARNAPWPERSQVFTHIWPEAS